jgi:hypothetical protein
MLEPLKMFQNLDYLKNTNLDNMNIFITNGLKGTVSPDF